MLPSFLFLTPTKNYAFLKNSNDVKQKLQLPQSCRIETEGVLLLHNKPNAAFLATVTSLSVLPARTSITAASHSQGNHQLVWPESEQSKSQSEYQDEAIGGDP